MNKISSTLFALIIFIATCHAQTALISKYKKYQYLTHAEKLYLATDRNCYICGDTLRFSGWLVNAGDLNAEKYEKILNVSFTDGEFNVIKQIIVPVDSGRIKGQLVIPESVDEGIYQLNAYTNYMRNMGDEFTFHKNIAIQSLKTDYKISSGNTYYLNKNDSDKQEESQDENVSIKKDDKNYSLDVTFLPEGGTFVSGVPCRMAVIATSKIQKSDSIEYSGIVYDEDNQKISFFNSEFRGRCSFMIVPFTEEKYHVVIKDQKGSEKTFQLPEIKDKGYVLRVEDKWGKDQIVLYVQSAGIVHDDSMFMVTSQKGKIVHAVPFVTSSGSAAMQIKKNDFSTGIVQVTLFNSSYMPLCERLLFINRNDGVSVNSKLDKDAEGNSYMTLTASNSQQLQVKGDWALSVAEVATNVDTLVLTPDIEQYMYLQSDLPGLEPDCGYIFGDDKTSHYKTELTMLTNGWRRFTWDQILSDSVPEPEYPLEKEFYIKGLVTRQSNNRPAPEGIDISMMASGEDILAGTAKTNSQGRFSFLLDAFNNKTKVTIQTKNRLNMKANFNIEMQTNLVQMENKSTILKKPKIVSHEIEHDTTLTAKTEKIEQATNDYLTIVQEKIDEAYFEDTTDVQIQEIEVKKKVKRTPMEEIHDRFGPSSIVVGENKIGLIDESGAWYNGLIDALDQLIPGFKTQARDFDMPNYVNQCAIDGDCPCLCDCNTNFSWDSYDKNNGGMSDGSYQFEYNGTYRFRLYFYVDGELCAFTNHNAQVDWAKFGFFNMGVKRIKSIEMIENPVESAIHDAYMANKQVEEMHCIIDPVGKHGPVVAHVYYNCPLGYDAAPEHIISIETKDGGGISGFQGNRGILVASLCGFSPYREFYQPGDSIKQSPSGIHCRTVYWNPEVKSDGEMSAYLDKLDPAKQYIVRLNGMTQQHSPVSYRTVIGNKNSKVVSEKNTNELNSNNKVINVITSQGEICSYVEVWSKHGSLADQALINGELVFNPYSVLLNDTICFMVPGLGNTTLTTKEFLFMNNIVVKSDLAETNSDLTANKIVKSISKNAHINYSIFDYDICGVSRNEVYAGSNLVRLTDFGFTQRIGSYRDIKDPLVTMTPDVHRYQHMNYSRMVPFKFNNYKTDFLTLVDLRERNLSFKSSEGFDMYDYSLNGIQELRGRNNYVIEFHPKKDALNAYYSGLMLIDTETRAIAYIQYEVEKDKREFMMSNLYLAPLKEKDHFELVNETAHSSYKYYEKGWKLSDASRQVSFNVNSRSYLLINELNVTDSPIRRIDGFKRTDPEKMNKTTVIQPIVKYNPEKWRKANALMPDDKLINQVSRLHENQTFKMK